LLAIGLRKLEAEISSKIWLFGGAGRFVLIGVAEKLGVISGQEVLLANKK